MNEGQVNAPEARNFEARLTPLMADFRLRHSMVPVDEVRYFGIDPKGGGRLFLAFFKSANFLLKVRTVDGAADVLLGPVGATLQWQDDGWFWPSQVAGTSIENAPDIGELTSLRDQLKGVGFI
ncbi:hypothetical protein [Dyella sp. C11]|uniref:hypothetical protein n=1 Tax=Dyella sp. C11 TaxID=2126991 RepID=UPI000D65AD4A|nr:hypothetical protein [Dyella sp. C11]